MSRNRAYTRNQRARSIRRVRRYAARWGAAPAEKTIRRLASHRGICSCGLCKSWKHLGGNSRRRWEGVRQMMREDVDD